MSEPDWKNFAKAVLTDWPTYDLDGSVLFDLSLQYGMIQEVPGGYNSDHHIDAEGICPEEGDPWYEYTFRGEAGPGLYSITDMDKRIEELETEVKALQRREIDANRAAMKHLRDLEQERINSKNYAEFNHIWRKRCEEMEAKLAVCEKYRDAYAECDRIGTQSVRELEAKLAKAVEALEKIDVGEGWAAQIARTTLAELKGGKDE